MAAPSSLPSARAIAQQCVEKNRQLTGANVPEGAETDLGLLAEHFIERERFYNFFITTLVNGENFHGNPNKGHWAVADFLVSKVCPFCISTNLDVLTESAVRELGIPDFRPALDGDQLSQFQTSYLKLHGCWYIDPLGTLWCKKQLEDNPTIRGSIERSTEWLSVNLRHKDLVFVGYWTDWAYLNDVLADCVSSVEPNVVILVDPADDGTLRNKAQRLYDWAHGQNVNFRHAQEYGDVFLDDLRRIFSTRFLVNLIEDSETVFEALSGEPTDASGISFNHLSTNELFALRRDACGQPRGKAVSSRQHEEPMRIFGALCIWLLKEGAILDGSLFRMGSTTLRIIQAAGQALSEVKNRFSREPQSLGTNIVICAGAFDDGGAASDIVRETSTPGLVRSNYSGEWVAVASPESLAELRTLLSDR